jgi:MYXO-CTERM domain-containing protein
MKKIVLLAAVAGTASAAFAQNTGARLTDGTAVYDVSSTGSTGTIPTSEATSTDARTQANLRISGGTAGSDNLYTNFWWYRVNGASTRELVVSQPTGAAVRTLSGTNGVNYVMTNGSLTFSLTFTLTQVNANTAVVNYSATATNNGPAAISLSMFNYVDYYLANADAADRLDSAFGPGAGNNGNRVLNISDSSNAGWGMSHWGYNSDGYIVGTFSGVGGQITDTSIDNFADTNSGAPVNPAAGTDIGGIMQWNFGNIATGGSATASAAIIVWNTAPTPGAAGLMGLGMLAAARRRRV